MRARCAWPVVENVTNLAFELHLDEQWDEAEAEPDFCKRPKFLRERKHVELLPASGTTGSWGEWGSWTDGAVKNVIRPHVWYFVLSDCEDRLVRNVTHRLKFEIRMTQEEGSELSAEMAWTPELTSLALLAFTFFNYRYTKLCLAFRKSADELHPNLWAFSGALLLQYLALVFRVVHLYKYTADGVGIKALDVLGEISAMVAQVVLTSMLLMIGLGYTLLQSRIGELDILIPIVLLIAVFHIVLVGVGRIRDDASTKFHENEGMPGWLLVGMRIAMYVWFLWAVNSTRQEAGMKLRAFLQKFTAAGTLYFLGYPVLWTLTGLLAAYLRQKILTAGMYAFQAAFNLWLTRLFLSRGDYFEVSTLNSSFLPGGTRPGVDKEE